MSRIKILSPYEIKKFDSVPLFNDNERHKFFAVSAKIKDKLNGLSANDSKIGFVLQLGYFKATGKFYSEYNHDDKAFIGKLLGINLDGYNTGYSERTRLTHKLAILEMLGYKSFNKSKALFAGFIANLISKQMHPRKIIFAMVDLLREQKVEVPNYDTFARTITSYLNKFEKNLALKIEANITNDHKDIFDSLLESGDNSATITKLRIISQSVRPSSIKQSVSGFILIKKLHNDIAVLLTKLDLSTEAIKYYANWVIKAKTSQIKAINDDNIRYLYLLAFIDHQYKNWQDIFIDTMLKVNQQHLNKIEMAVKESHSEFAARNSNLLGFVLSGFDKQADLIGAIKKVVYDTETNNNNKIKQLKVILSKEKQETDSVAKVNELKKNLDHYNHNKQNLIILERASRKLQNRLADIVKHIEFVVAGDDLRDAIVYYQNNNLTKAAPNKFLQQNEIEIIYNNGFNASLYKVLLFMKIVEAIKSGDVSLARSYRYMPIESYLIKEKIWQERKEELLEKLGLQEFADINNILTKLRTELNYKYSRVNKNLATNKYIKIKEDGNFSLSTPAPEKPHYDSIYKIIGYDNYIPILQMMSEVNNMIGFTGNFKHHKVKGVQQKISDETIFAGLFALGSNIGVHKLANTAVGVSYNSLLHGVNWHFSLENLYATNNMLVDFMSKMWLPEQFQKEQNLLHTSSDGKKRCVSAESLNANYSYKYFGHGRGSNIYTFIDERNILFYSTVFSSSERDSAYVIDGLQHNVGVKSDIHSTDTEGYTELVFALSHLMKTSFAPRIKNLGTQYLVSFDKQDANYIISPNRYVNEKYMRNCWDTVLRLLATILLREEKASTIMKRLSSYDKQHRLYVALKEFGRIIKTCFILDIIDNVELRQQIEKQLNKGELSNRFQGAIVFANNQELTQVGRDEQEQAAMCQMILQNIIVLWNYVKLTKVIMTSDTLQRPFLMENITNGSILMWRHVNMLGTYDFRNLAANEPTNVEELLSFRMVA